MSVNGITGSLPLELPNGQFVMSDIEVDVSGSITITFINKELAEQFCDEAIKTNRIFAMGLYYSASVPKEPNV